MYTCVWMSTYMYTHTHIYMGGCFLFCFGNLLAGFSSLNFVDDKIMSQCQKVGQNVALCKAKGRNNLKAE